jgi:hypothetical protein
MNTRPDVARLNAVHHHRALSKNRNQLFSMLRDQLSDDWIDVNIPVTASPELAAFLPSTPPPVFE